MSIVPSTEPRLIMLSEPPFRIVFINEAWAEQRSTAQSFVEGRPFAQDLDTSKSQLETLHMLSTDCAACSLDINLNNLHGDSMSYRKFAVSEFEASFKWHHQPTAGRT